MINSIILLSGGLATRLKPLSLNIPKSLIDINGKPFIELQLEIIKRQNISNVIICAGYLGDMIQNYLGNGDKYGMNFNYSFDGDKLLGTGGAVKNAMHLLKEHAFYVMYGDSYLNIDFKPLNEYFQRLGKSGLMTVFKNDDRWDSSNIVFENGEIIKYDKKNKIPEMKYIDYGLGILTKEGFESFKNKENFDLADVYSELLKNNELLGFEVKERFYEIGSFEGLKEIKELLSRKN